MTGKNENILRLARLQASGLARCRPIGAVGASIDPLAAPPARDRIEGMLLGIAIGDGLGNTSESMRPQARRASFGAIRDYLPNHHAGYQRVGLPSDDTQLSFWTVESVLAAGRVDPEDLARRFAGDAVFGSGKTFRQFMANYKAGAGWERAGVESAGDGALMRTAPLVLPSLAEGGEGLVADLAIGALLTHNDSAAIASSVAFGVMLRELLVAAAPPPRDWWQARFSELASAVETPTEYRQRGGGMRSGTISALASSLLPGPLARGERSLEACESWGSGAYLPETVPCALFILARYAADPEEAVVRAVNDTKDNDTVAAIVGAAVGALHGAGALPPRWLESLTGRTRESDDGAAQRLARQAAERYGR